MKPVKFSLLIFGILMLFLFSEALYLYNHPNEISVYSIALAKFANSTGNTSGAFFILLNSAKAVIVQNTTDYPKVVPEISYKFDISNNENLKKQIADYLNSLPGDTSDIRGKYDLARVFYDFSVIAYKNGDANLTPEFMKISLGLNPQLSYWPVELANFYLYNGDNVGAKKILDSCTTMNAPKQHCLDYSNDNLIHNRPNNIGFLEETVNDYYTPIER